ncbi:MAG: hypothetical protein ACE5GV_00385 [Candidatus Scalindua sp.]
MTFNASVPQSTDDPSVSQGQLLTNFTQLNTIFGNNHITFDAPSDNGKHNFCQFPEQGAAPVTAANEGALYTKQSAASATELFFRRESSGTELPLTGLPVTTVVAGGVTVNGITTPWGLVINWGSGSLSGGTRAITWAVAYAGTPAITCTKLSTAVNNQPTISGESNVGATVNGAATDGFSFIAIGV